MQRMLCTIKKGAVLPIELNEKSVVSCLIMGDVRLTLQVVEKLNEITLRISDFERETASTIYVSRPLDLTDLVEDME